MQENTTRVEKEELYISVDIETSGPIPFEYSLLAIGACLVNDPTQTFYQELQPISDRFSFEALQISGLSLERLKETGSPPVEAMRTFQEWVERQTPPGARPVFVAFNAPFDWMFINTYFLHYLGSNPFGHNALDIKAFIMGRRGGTWSNTSLRVLSPLYLDGQPLTHNALEDAQVQAKLFQAAFTEANPVPETQEEAR